MSYMTRKDNRSDEVFKHNLKDFHEREAKWGVALGLDFEERGNPCVINEIGADNTGDVIKGKLPPNKGDKEYVFKDGTKKRIEIKTIPERFKDFMSFKVCALTAAKQWETTVVVARVAGYYTFPVEMLDVMLTTYPHRIYPGFSPNDPAVRIWQEDIDKWVEEGKVTYTSWSSKASQYVTENESILTREKRT